MFIYNNYTYVYYTDHCVFFWQIISDVQKDLLVDTSIGKHHQHMRCNADVSSSWLSRWHLSDTKKSPTSLDASILELRPLQVEVEWSEIIHSDELLKWNRVDSRNCSTLWLTSGWLHSDRIFLVMIFCCCGCARHSPPLRCFCGYKGCDFSQVRHLNHRSSNHVKKYTYIYTIQLYNYTMHIQSYSYSLWVWQLVTNELSYLKTFILCPEPGQPVQDWNDIEEYERSPCRE